MPKHSIFTRGIMGSAKLFFLVTWFLTFFHVSNCFYCTESYCAEITASYNKPCPDTRNCTKIGYRKFLDPSPCNCCEYCFDYLKENDTCSQSAHQKPLELCGPYLTCAMQDQETERAICKKIKTGPGDKSEPDYCMTIKDEYETAYQDGSVMIAQMNPNCDSGGNYAPRQCLPGSICYCSNSTGGRIFGIALPHEYQDCACARDIALLQELGFEGKFPHCLPNGDYDELQCVVRSCYCRSHPENVVAMHELDQLPCYDNRTHVFDPSIPEYYFHDCELKRARMEVQIADAELEGVKKIVADIPKCDPDGSYSPIQSDFDRLYCADQNGEQIEYFEAQKFTDAAYKMNCYCARAKLLLKDSATGKPRCCSNGNYKPWQCIGSKCFCVDLLGRQNVSRSEVHEDEMHTLECYSKRDSEDGTEPDCEYEDDEAY